MLPRPAPFRWVDSCRGALLAACCLLAVAPATAADAYTQQEDVIFAQEHGIALAMDIFRPTGAANGLALVDIASGAWHSDRGKINDHKQAQMYDIFCGRGYTVFAVRPGSITRFSAPEMVDHVKQGIRWVKLHAAEYGIDPLRLGLAGASAGGHLTCLTAATADDGQSDAKDPAARFDSRVMACVAFFPPTDFLSWGKTPFDPDKAEGRVASLLGPLMFPLGLHGQSREEMLAQLEKISPARLVTSQMPPLLLIHGDADFVVPLQQSEVMLAAMQKAGIACELIVKKGGGHPWPTIHEEVRVAADWFDRQLTPPAAATTPQTASGQ